MKKIGIAVLVLLLGMTVKAEGEPKELYARSAVLMDADSGRVLFEKNGYEKRTMASTTKIMTCIIALENGTKEDVVTVSEHAARQPKVHLGMKKGERYRLQDLLYSLMLESHNDSAVAIAEHIGGSVEGFASMMNEKAAEIGCRNTYFITPNGLDAKDEKGAHSTTAAELGSIMRYCVGVSPKKEEFLEITGKKSHRFSDKENKRNFFCNNHNALLGMMEGAFSGKTGFTGEAGYCYVGALRREKRTFIVVLLGCGWPNNKTYKWLDSKELLNYGLENYHYKDVEAERNFLPKTVEGGIPTDGKPGSPSKVEFLVEESKNRKKKLLLKEGEEIEVKTEIKDDWKAPVRAGEKAGTVSYYLRDELLLKEDVITGNAVEKMTFEWCFFKLLDYYVL